MLYINLDNYVNTLNSVQAEICCYSESANTLFVCASIIKPVLYFLHARVREGPLGCAWCKNHQQMVYAKALRGHSRASHFLWPRVLIQFATKAPTVQTVWRSLLLPAPLQSVDKKYKAICTITLCNCCLLFKPIYCTCVEHVRWADHQHTLSVV